jgi:molybdopterin converting factor small subunit
MAVLVKLSSTLRQFVSGYDPAAGLSIEADGLTVRQALAKIGVPEEKVRVVMINGLHTNLDQPLKDGDRVGLFPPVGGG